jgi:hypothetical protein
MRILYYSVHSVLEHDEVSLLRSLGHEVLSLGEYFDGALGQSLRPMLPPSPGEAALHEAFHAGGGQFRRFTAPEETVLPPAVVALFDAVVVMHSCAFIEHHWEALRQRPVVLRTIGVNLHGGEPDIARLRARGVRVVRYSPIEETGADYAGADAVIRFHKDETVHAGWTGHERRGVMFAADFRQRFPGEAALWEEITADLPMVLGGAGNFEPRHSIGYVDFAHQMALLRGSRAYFKCSCLHMPYTLSLIEAWITGLPVVAMDPRAVESALPFAEWPRLFRPGADALLARDAAEARAMLRALLDDHGFAARLGAAGRESAIRLFGREAVVPHWQRFLAGLG